VLKRRGPYLRKVCAKNNGFQFGLPAMVAGQIRYAVPWSCFLKGTEKLLAINTNCCQANTACLTIDEPLHQDRGLLTCTYSADSRQVGQESRVELRKDQAVLLTVTAAGFVVYEWKQHMKPCHSSRPKQPWQASIQIHPRQHQCPFPSPLVS